MNDALRQLLSDWHSWCAGYSTISGYGSASVMFKQSKSPRHWDTTGELDDAAIHRANMAALDFAILGDKQGHGALPEPSKSAILTLSATINKGKVIVNPRLPVDAKELSHITNIAIKELTNRLQLVGVL